MSQEGVLALPNPVRDYRHESFGIREYHNELVMSEGIFKSQTSHDLATIRTSKHGWSTMAPFETQLNERLPKFIRI